MTYYELIENIRDLGFSDDTEIAEFETDNNIISNSVNRAVTEINLNVANIIGTLDINPYQLANELDDVLVEIRMPDMDEMFLAFSDTPVKRELGDTEHSGVYEKFFDYEIESEDTLIISSNYDGNYRIFYIKAHDPVTSDIIDSSSDIAQEDIPLPRKVHHLVPLLTAYFVWLEDDPSKATQYYNLYEQMRGEIIGSTRRLKGTIVTGGRSWL